MGGETRGLRSWKGGRKGSSRAEGPERNKERLRFEREVGAGTAQDAGLRPRAGSHTARFERGTAPARGSFRLVLGDPAQGPNGLRPTLDGASFKARPRKAQGRGR